MSEINFQAYLIPMISIALTYIVGRFSDRANLKAESLKERYENFYIPYTELLIRASPKFPYIITNPEIAIEFGNLIIEKSHYLEPKTSKYAIEYYALELDYFEYYHGNPDFKDAEYKINQLLIRISMEIMLESTKVAKELKMPPVSLNLYEILKSHTNEVK